VRNLDKVKVGDTVVATYYASIALVLSAPGTQVPNNQSEFPPFRCMTVSAGVSTVRLLPGYAGRLPSFAYAASGARRKERIGAFWIDIGGSYAAHHGTGKTAPRTRHSSVRASVDIGS